MHIVVNISKVWIAHFLYARLCLFAIQVTTKQAKRYVRKRHPCLHTVVVEKDKMMYSAFANQDMRKGIGEIASYPFLTCRIIMQEYTHCVVFESTDRFSTLLAVEVAGKKNIEIFLCTLLLSLIPWCVMLVTNQRKNWMKKGTAAPYLLRRICKQLQTSCAPMCLRVENYVEPFGTYTVSPLRIVCKLKK